MPIMMNTAQNSPTGGMAPRGMPMNAPRGMPPPSMMGGPGRGIPMSSGVGMQQNSAPNMGFDAFSGFRGASSGNSNQKK